MDQPTQTPKKSPGAPPGNTNALKHGFYSRAFRNTEETDLSNLDLTTLEHEIQLLRVFIRRTAEQNKDAAPEESIILLSVLSRAALSVGSLIRTQRVAILVQKQNDIDAIAAQGRAEFARARELINRCNARLTELEAAYAGDEEEEGEEEEEDGDEEDETEDENKTAAPQEDFKYSLEPDAKNCDVPNDCVACPDHFTCPDCPGELKEFLTKHPTAAAIVSNCSTNFNSRSSRRGPRGTVCQGAVP